MIKDFNRFMYNQTQHRERKHFCMHCLKCFSSERVLADHREVCVSINGKQAIRMPEPGSILKYENRRKQLDAPLVIYADFEAITEKVSVVRRSAASHTQIIPETHRLWVRLCSYAATTTSTANRLRCSAAKTQ